ncbi:hypothetical protein FIE12Z_12797, partial [Fusarium flagelliforme]
KTPGRRNHIYESPESQASPLALAPPKLTSISISIRGGSSLTRYSSTAQHR